MKKGASQEHRSWPLPLIACHRERDRRVRPNGCTSTLFEARKPLPTKSLRQRPTGLHLSWIRVWYDTLRDCIERGVAYDGHSPLCGFR